MKTEQNWVGLELNGCCYDSFFKALLRYKISSNDEICLSIFSKRSFRESSSKIDFEYCKFERKFATSGKLIKFGLNDKTYDMVYEYGVDDWWEMGLEDLSIIRQEEVLSAIFHHNLIYVKDRIEEVQSILCTLKIEDDKYHLFDVD